MTGSTAMSFGGAQCTRCGQGFAPKEEMVNSNGEIWHTKCFVDSTRESGRGTVRGALQGGALQGGALQGGAMSNQGYGVGAARGKDDLVLGIERMQVNNQRGAAGFQENKFPVDSNARGAVGLAENKFPVDAANKNLGGFRENQFPVNPNGENRFPVDFGSANVDDNVAASGYTAGSTVGQFPQDMVQEINVDDIDVSGADDGVSVGLRENRFPVDMQENSVKMSDTSDVNIHDVQDDAVSDSGTYLESVQGDFEPEGELQWQESGFPSQAVEQSGQFTQQNQSMEVKLAQEKRGEDVDVVLGLKESPARPARGPSAVDRLNEMIGLEMSREREDEIVQEETIVKVDAREKKQKPEVAPKPKSGLKRQSSLQEARSRFQDPEGEDRSISDQASVTQESAIPDASYKYESTEVDTTIIRKRKTDKRNGLSNPGVVNPLTSVSEQTGYSQSSTQSAQDIEPIYQPYKKPEPPTRVLSPEPRVLSPEPRVLSPEPRSNSPEPPRPMSPEEPPRVFSPEPSEDIPPPVPPPPRAFSPTPPVFIAPEPPPRVFSPEPPPRVFSPEPPRSMSSPEKPPRNYRAGPPIFTAPDPPPRPMSPEELPRVMSPDLPPPPRPMSPEEPPRVMSPDLPPPPRPMSPEEPPRVMSPDLPPPPRPMSPEEPPRVMSPDLAPPPRVLSPEPRVTSPEPIYADLSDPSYQTSFKQTERQDFEMDLQEEEENLSKFPTSLEFNNLDMSLTNGRPPTEYVNGPPDVAGGSLQHQQQVNQFQQPIMEQYDEYDNQTQQLSQNLQQLSQNQQQSQNDLQNQFLEEYENQQPQQDFMGYEYQQNNLQNGQQNNIQHQQQSQNQQHLQQQAEYDGGTLRAQSTGQQRSIVTGPSGDVANNAGSTSANYDTTASMKTSGSQQQQQEYDGGTLRAQSGGRQQSIIDNYKPLPDPPINGSMKVSSKGSKKKGAKGSKAYPLPDRPIQQFGSKMFCCKCERPLDLDSPIVNYNGSVWHPQCFVCVQCFQPFPEGIFYEFEGRKYCEHDFHMLFAPCCGQCGEFVVGRVIKAMNANWHPHCFLCELCRTPLADAGFYKNAGRALCKECNNKEKAAGMGKYVCHKCHSIIEEGHIKFKGEAYHPYHFNCTNCEVELNADAREKNGELFCLRCHDKMGIPICGACRRPIEERVVHALGKTWHVEHFVCAKCEKPFLGARHYEKRGLAYCEIHYHQLFGNMCFVCNNVVAGDVFSALNKAWCANHFACYLCDKKLNQKNKFFEFDLKPVCKMCYEHFPSELKKRMKKAYDSPKK